MAHFCTCDASTFSAINLIDLLVEFHQLIGLEVHEREFMAVVLAGVLPPTRFARVLTQSPNIGTVRACADFLLASK